MASSTSNRIVFLGTKLGNELTVGQAVESMQRAGLRYKAVSNFSKLTCYIICGIDITLPEYRRLQRFEKLHSVDLSSVLLLESGFQLLLAGFQPTTVSLREVISAQNTDYTTIDAALELPWGRIGGAKRSPSDALAGSELPGRRVARRAAHHGGSLAESPVQQYSQTTDDMTQHESPAALPPSLPAALQGVAAHVAAPAPSAAPAATPQPAPTYTPKAQQRAQLTQAQHAAAVAKHRPCAQDVAAGLRVVSVLEALLAQRAAMAHLGGVM